MHEYGQDRGVDATTGTPGAATYSDHGIFRAMVPTGRKVKKPKKESLAEHVVDMYLAAKVGGAVFSFMAFLTTQPKVVVASAYHEPTDLLNAYQAWQDQYGLSRAEPEVTTWDNPAPLYKDPL